MTEHDEATQEAPEVTSDDRLQKIAESRAVVAAKAKELEAAEAKLEGAKNLAKLKRQAYDEAVTDLLDVIDNKQQVFEFDDPEAATAPDDWRSVPLDIEVIPHNHIIQKLADAGIKTMGELSDAIAAEPEKGVAAIEGLGPVAAEKVENALESFWHAHPEWAIGSTNPEDAPAEDDEGILT